MNPDYNTLLLAIGLSAFCLAATLFASWLSARIERFLLCWSIGIGLIVPAVIAYGAYVETQNIALGSVSFGLQLAGFAFIYGAAYRFRTARPARRRIVVVLAISCSLAIPPLVAGFDGIAFIVFNAVVAVYLFATACEYWWGRGEAPLPLTGIAILYAMTAVSFTLCSGVLLYEGNWVMGHAPSNWAENLNLITAIIGITGIGAMSLALNQWRIAGNHHRAAMTDSLTGILNRRALFDRYATSPVDAHTAIVAFDLDSFKVINDRYGHAAGDIVLKTFADILSTNCRDTDSAARLGGEEFALVLHRALPERAARVAESVRDAFAAQLIPIGNRSINCTVSAGIAFGSGEGLHFDAVMNNADKALYASKRDGRNRVSLADDLRRSA
jgi:diguanylate cyclase (GGDEF)-like protein